MRFKYYTTHTTHTLHTVWKYNDDENNNNKDYHHHYYDITVGRWVRAIRVNI